MIEKWMEFGVGAIMIASPWILGFSDISLAKWCNVLVGILLVLVSSWTIFGEPAQTAAVTEELPKERRRVKNNVEQK